jgi:hypothetical protein
VRTTQHCSAYSFILTYNPPRWPCSPHNSALVLSSLQSCLWATTTCLSFAWSPALSQTLLEGLSTLPCPPRHSPSCDMVKTPIFWQRTSAEHPQLPPLTGNHYLPPSNRIQLCSFALSTAPQTPLRLQPHSPQILLSLVPSGPYYLMIISRSSMDSRLMFLSPPTTIVTTQQPLHSLSHRIEDPFTTFYYEMVPTIRYPNDSMVELRRIFYLPPPEALGEVATTFWESARPPCHSGR